MYKLFFIAFLFTARQGIAQQVVAQPDSNGREPGTVVVVKDARIDQLVHKQIAINEETTRDSRRFVPGFRIEVINSTDRSKVFAAKAKIYQEFPDLKPYLLYQAPYYKLRVGNFQTQDEAEDYLKQLSGLFPAGLYVIRDVIEIKLSDLIKADTTNP